MFKISTSFIFVLVFFLLFCFSGNSQTHYFQKKINEADSLFIQLKNHEALIAFKNLLQENGINTIEKALTNYKIACCFLEIQEYDSAEVYLKSSLKINNYNSFDLTVKTLIKTSSLPKNSINLDKNISIIFELIKQPQFDSISTFAKVDVYYYLLHCYWLLKDEKELNSYYQQISDILFNFPNASFKTLSEKYEFTSYHYRLGIFLMITKKDSVLAKKHFAVAESIMPKELPYCKKLYNIAYGHYYFHLSKNTVPLSKFYFIENAQIVPDDSYDFSAAHFMIGKIYTILDSIEKAIVHFKIVEKHLKGLHEIRWSNHEVLRWLAEAYTKNGDSLNGLKYYTEVTEMGNKLNKQNNASILNTFTFLQEKQKIEFNYENEKQKFIFIICSSAFALLILLIVFFIYRKLNKTLIKQKTDLEASLLQNSLLTKEMHHRVKNNLNMISSLLNLQSKKLTNEDAIKALKDGQNRIKSVAILHQGLYQNTDNVSGQINLNDYITRLSEHISHIFKNEQKEVIIDIAVSKEITLRLDIAIPLGLIVNEFITNSFKHAFSDTEQCSISIFVEYKKSENEFVLIYQDSGKGFDEIKNNKSFGFALIDMLILQLNASLSLSTEKGTKYTVDFKNT